MADANMLWLPVAPSLRDFGPALIKGVAKDAEKAGKTSGKTFGLALGAAAATFAGVAAAGTALFNVGKTFQDMTNTIRVGTGAAGDDLDGFVDIAKRVGTQVPHEWESIGNAVADVNTQMGLTGDDLELVTSQILEAGRMLGEEVDITSVGQSFQAFGVETDDMSDSLDFLFNVSQTTGIGMNDLANQTRQAAPAAEALGFSFEETAGLIGQLDNAGLDSGKMLQNMSRRLKDVAQDGEEPRDTFNRVAAEIQEMVESGDRFGAQDLAGTAFGTRNAEQFIKALEDGTMNLDDLTGAAEHSGDTIMGLSEETMTFSEHWQVFKNRLEEALAPVAERVFGGMGDMMEDLSGWMTDTLIPAFESFIGWIERSSHWLVPLVATVAGFAGSIIAVNTAMGIWNTLTKAWTTVTTIATAVQKGLNAAMKANPIGLIITAITLLVGALIWFFTETELGQEIWEKFTTFLGEAWENIKNFFIDAYEDYIEPVFSGIGDWIGDVGDWFSDLGESIGDIWDSIKSAFTDAYEEYVEPIFDDIIGWIDDVIGWFEDFGDGVADVWDSFTGWMSDAEESAADAWSNMEDGLADLGNWFSEKGSEIGDAWSDMNDRVTEGAIDIRDNALDWVQTKMREVAEFFTDDSTAIGQAFLTLYEWLSEIWGWIDEYVFEPYKRAFALVKSLFTGDSEEIGQAWEDLKDSLRATFEEVVRRVTDPFKDAFGAVRDWFEDRADDMRDKWDSFQEKLTSIYETYIEPVFDTFSGAIESLKDTFDTVVDGIETAWDKLREVAAKPVYFVVQRVLNEGLIAGFNNTLGKIPGVSDLGEIDVPNWVSQYGYARGGWTGPGGKYDPAGIVHADEFVIRKESRRRFEHLHPGLLSHINAHGSLLGYADGGLVTPVQGPLTSRFGPRGGGVHAGVDWAVPVGTPVRAALPGTVARAGWNIVSGRTGLGMLLAHDGNRNTYYGHLSRVVARLGDTVSKGQAIALSGNTGNSTGPHLHFETWTGGSPVDPLSHMGGLPASADGGSGWFDPLAPFRAIWERAKGWVADRFPDGGPFVEAGLGVATKAFTDIVDWVSGILGFGGDSDTAGGVGAGSASSAAAQAQVRNVAARYGWDSGSQWTALDKLIQRESSWNPNAANPNSTARGLFQKMTSIHGPVESTAAGQAEWGLDYIRGRYGSPLAAVMHHKQRGWYADGGHVAPLFRDRGGNLPPGLSMVLNNTGRDETILPGTPRDVEAAFLRQGAGAGVHIHGDVWAHSPEQVAQEIHKDARRAAALAPVL